ncbi:TetR/AcrR family transcriptional regulator [Brasilonema sp. UFV-L1]|uniref:TetR/AcrR family transcriptional regulator n=1 Tax=Brasilonema sp. UFV-L1 TaxID=2234130 RepID=UPI00145DDD41|nr:TetR/AcrR family transcriptional regulator [Brasilonema sp. UFV-L1]NMG09556.1 TetR/AcrR family transcriptional regulator [Brasilonema sp. UFV-L1]
MPRKISTTPRKLPQQDRSKVTVDAILSATARILTEEGYDKASTNRIAELAGVSIGSLYQYFPNKEALVAALVSQHTNEMVELVESKLSDLFDVPPEVAIPELVKAVISAHAVNPMLHKVLDEEVPRIGRLKQVENAEEQINAMLRAYLERWSDDLTGSRSKGDRPKPQNLDLTVFILGRTVESLCHAAVIEHPELLSDGQLEQEIANLLLSYLLEKMS